MKFFSMKKKRTEPPEYTAATMEFLKKQTPVTFRVEPPGYRTHEFVLPASHLRSPHFEPLIPKADVEYGGAKGIVFVITCKLDDFLHAMVETDMDIRAPCKPSRPPLLPFGGSNSCPGRRTLGWFLARTH
jgi:hypothetical protein